MHVRARLDHVLALAEAADDHRADVRVREPQPLSSEVAQLGVLEEQEARRRRAGGGAIVLPGVRMWRRCRGRPGAAAAAARGSLQLPPLLLESERKG